MKVYSLPPQLDKDIEDLEDLVARFRKGSVQPTELKAHRVPFGVYEQREPDTYMVRIRCAAGIISPLQLEKVAAMAARYGSGDLHITTRQELQIHSVLLDDIISMIRQLKESGLATRGGGGNTVRNITAQEDAGIDPAEEFDVTPYAVALTTRFMAEDDSWNLPRKFKIAFSGSAEDKGYATLADIGFIAAQKAKRKGFRVYAAGGLGAKSAAGKLLLDFIETSEVYPVAKAIKTLFWKYGNRKNRHAARLRFLWDSLGEDEFKRRFREEYERVKKADSPPLAIDEAKDDSPVSPGASGEAPGDKQGFELWKKRFVKEQKQDGLFSAEIAVELGFISHERAARLAKFIMPFGDDTVRMTKDQNFMLRNIPGKYLGSLYNFLNDVFPDLNRPAIYGRILSCAGASTCQLGICLSRQAAKALMNILEKSGIDLDRASDIKLNISGCPNSCGQHPAADLGFAGKALRKEGKLYPAYSVVCGAVIGDGRTRLAGQAGEIPAKALPKMVTDIFTRYISKAAHKNIREYMQAAAKEDIKEICAGYKDIPGFDEDKNYYFDWGSQDLFSLAERRGGECSAGIFDLIEMDLKNIKDTRLKLESAGVDKEKRAGLIDRLVFYSARVLLVTRGVEPKTDEEAYQAFLRHFVDTGLVAASFKDIIKMAGHKDRQALLDKGREALELAGAVESLYENMDNSFNFPKKGTVPEGDCPLFEKPAVIKDLRGVACPMNFVKTKAELARLKSGDSLEIWLDDGAPIENVPGSVKAEGHKIIAQKKIDNYWSIVIEKR